MKYMQCLGALIIMKNMIRLKIQTLRNPQINIEIKLTIIIIIIIINMSNISVTICSCIHTLIMIQLVDDYGFCFCYLVTNLFYSITSAISIDLYRSSSTSICLPMSLRSFELISLCQQLLLSNWPLHVSTISCTVYYL